MLLMYTEREINIKKKILELKENITFLRFKKKIECLCHLYQIKKKKTF